MDQSLQLQLAIAHAFARGKQKRELTEKVKLAAKRRAVRGATPEQIVRRMAHEEK